MLDKNPDQILDNELIFLKNDFSKKNPNMILYSEPFVKGVFLNKLINSLDYRVIFLDFDLLYSGYVRSEMIRKNDKLEIFCPNKINFKKKLSEIIKIISNEKRFLVVDSLNGFYSMYDEKESGRFINASLMLLSSVGKNTESQVLVNCMAREKTMGNWILSPTGRHIFNSKKLGIFHLDKIDNSLTVRSLDPSWITKKTFKIIYKHY